MYVIDVQGPAQAGAAELWVMEASLACGSAKSCLPALLLALAATQTHTPMHYLLSSTLKVTLVHIDAEPGHLASIQVVLCVTSLASPKAVQQAKGAQTKGIMQHTNQASNLSSKNPPKPKILSLMYPLCWWQCLGYRQYTLCLWAEGEWSAGTSSALLFQQAPKLSVCIAICILFRQNWACKL